MTHVERRPRRFESLDAALEAAEGHYPLDYLVAKAGDRRRPCQPAQSEGALRAAWENACGGTHPLDALYIWLPLSKSPYIAALGLTDSDVRALHEKGV